MASYNHIAILGTIDKLQPIKQLPTGITITKFSLTCDESYTNKEGQTVPRTMYIDVEVWGPLATKFAVDIIAGKQVIVEGALKTESWTDQTGTKKTKHVINAKNIIAVNGPSLQEQEILKKREAVLYQDNPF